MTTCRYINSSQSNFKFETEIVNILGHESEAQVGSIHEKIRGQKSHATVPFSQTYYTILGGKNIL
jgi:hypothetical protein